MSHDHNHSVANYNRAFALGILLNIVFVVVEAGYGFFIHSLALLADAGHNLSDVVSLLLAWGANLLAAKSNTDQRTYGYRKATILASLTSAILLLVALGGIVWEAIARIQQPHPIEGLTVIIVASIGVVINTITALLFVKGQKEDLNIRGAFLHMAADAGISLGVVVAGILMILYNWLWIDAAVSLMIALVIFISTWGLLRDSLNYAMDSVPKGVDSLAIKQLLMSANNVESIHDLHIWPLSTTEIALTAHLVINHNSIDNDFLVKIQKALRQKFNIAHSTIQVETLLCKNDCLLKNTKCD